MSVYVVDQKPVNIHLIETKYRDLFDYYHDNDNRSAAASLTTRQGIPWKFILLK